MFTSDEILGFSPMFQICVRFMRNSLLFIFYTYTFLTHYRMKNPIDFIFIHLTLVNILNIMFNLIPHFMSSFGDGYFLDEIGCKATLFFVCLFVLCLLFIQ